LVVFSIDSNNQVSSLKPSFLGRGVWDNFADYGKIFWTEFDDSSDSANIIIEESKELLSFFW